MIPVTKALLITVPYIQGLFVLVSRRGEVDLASSIVVDRYLASMVGSGTWRDLSLGDKVVVCQESLEYMQTCLSVRRGLKKLSDLTSRRRLNDL